MRSRLDVVGEVDGARSSSRSAMKAMSASNASRSFSPTIGKQRRQLELGRQRLAHAVDGRELGHPLLRLVDQPSRPERHAEAGGQGREQRDVALVEGMLAIQVLEGDHAQDLVAHEQRHEDRRQRRLALDLIRLSELATALTQLLGDQQRLPRLEHVLPEAHDRPQVVGEPLPALDGERERHGAVLVVEDGDVDHLGVEHVARSLPDELVHGLRIELRGQRGLDVVHDRQLGGASLRLVEQARVLERDAETGGERGEQTHVGLGERVRAVEVLERDPAAQLAAGGERREQDRQGRFSLDDRRRRPRSASQRGMSFTSRGWRVSSRTCAMCASLSGVGWSGNRTPRSIVYG